MGDERWMIYGAYGYTGRLLADEALRRGHRPMLAGRSEAALREMGGQLGLPWRAFALDDHAALVAGLEGQQLVLHAAGPFSHTSAPMIEACLEVGAHYLDVTGEIEVFSHTFAQDARARERGVTLISGVGFDVVPSDCLAVYVAQQVAGATELQLGIAALGSVSAGTARSMLEGGLQGAIVRRDGELVSRAFGADTRTLAFPHGAREVMAIGWGDVESAFHSTGIANITAYMTFPPDLIRGARATHRVAGAFMPVARGLLSRGPLKAMIDRRLGRIEGPDAAARGKGESHLWARASAPDGRAAEAWLTTVDGYSLTALTGVRCAEELLQDPQPGALSPAMAFGADFIMQFEGTRRFDSLP